MDNKIKNIDSIELSSALDERFTQYAIMTLEDRALPDARDGLKPSQRRVLVAMNDLNLTPRSSTEKSAKICGDTSGNYHPHGEAIVYPTMCRMAQDWVMREPLLIPQGNFGNIDGDPPAAMRYTEAKLSAIGMAMLEDLSESVVQFIPTYNEKRNEPTVLPASFPNLLINGAQGIAVGWATTIPTHNYIEVAKAIELWINKNGNIKPSDLIKIMPGPDFPTGGKILGQEGVLEYYTTGHGALLIEGKWELSVSSKGLETIKITELPYQSSPEALALEIEELVKSEVLTGIVDLKNLSSKKTGICVVIDIAKNTNSSIIINNLLKHTSLRKQININMTVLNDSRIIPDASIITLLEAFINHRRCVLNNKFNAELQHQLDKILLIDGFISVSKKIDEVIKIIRNAEDDKEAIKQLLASGIVLHQVQADAILSITLRQLTKLEDKKLIEDKIKREERTLWLRNVLGNPAEIDKLIKTEQLELAKKFGSTRKTEISGAAIDIDNESLIKDDQLIIALTNDGYIKSIPKNQFKIQSRGGKGVNAVNDKSENTVLELFESNSKDTLLFFTNNGMMYRKRTFEIPQCNKTAKGTHLSNLLSLQNNELITNVIPIESIESSGFLVIATKRGFIKRSRLKDYDTALKTSGLTAIKLNDGDEVSFVMYTNGKSDLFIVTTNGNCVRYSEDLLVPQGRVTQGVQAFKIDSSDTVVKIISIDNNKELNILVVTTAGHGKKTDAVEYRSSKTRYVAGYSVLNKTSIDKNGKVIGVCVVDKNDTVLISTKNGKIIRMNVDDIKQTKRTTSGVKVVNLDKNDEVKLISCCKIVIEE